MSDTVKLSPKLPGDPEINGLDAFADHLLNPDHEMLVCIVYIDAAKSTKDYDTGTEVPLARIRRIEPLGVIGQVSETVKAAVATAEQERTGRKPLPFETVEVGEYKWSDTIDSGEDEA